MYNISIVKVKRKNYEKMVMKKMKKIIQNFS